MRSRFVAGVLTVLVLLALAGGLLLWSGVVDVAANKASPHVDRILAYASLRSIKRHAPIRANPETDDPKALEVGLTAYKQQCVVCHGGPGAESAEFAAGLHPSAPDLGSPEIQFFDDGMLYQVIANGIGNSGMPAFEASHSEKELWSLVAFVRHLPKLTDDEKAKLARAPDPASPEQTATAASEEKSAGKHLHHISVGDSKFDPPSLEVQLGDSVEFANADFIAHTATAKDGTFDTRKIDGGGSKRIVAKKKGTFPYYCRYHNGMTGTLVVR
jgi:plastocyanin